MTTGDVFAEVMDLVCERGAVTLVPELVDAIAGEKIKGSWWSHPMGKTIFDVANRLEEAPEILTAKLIGGKVTFLHARLWPALVRIVTDAGWRRGRMKDLDEDARRLLRRVERSGRVDASDRALAPSRKELEARVLVRSTQEHSDAGRHVTILVSWRAWTPDATVTEASALDLPHALALLKTHRIDLTPR